MEFKSKLFAILAVFCVILSVCAVSAAHVSDYDMTITWMEATMGMTD